MRYIPVIKTHISWLLCDIGKPLECVDDEILLLKLNFYGFQGKAGEWFESYLKGKVVPVHTMKAYWGSKDIVPPFLSLSCRFR
jgi:hypothetical protein